MCTLFIHKGPTCFLHEWAVSCSHQLSMQLHHNTKQWLLVLLATTKIKQSEDKNTSNRTVKHNLVSKHKYKHTSWWHAAVSTWLFTPQNDVLVCEKLQYRTNSSISFSVITSKPSPHAATQALLLIYFECEKMNEFSVMGVGSPPGRLASLWSRLTDLAFGSASSPALYDSYRGS